jgi:VIT1/CCC1 family predicted Fe2+/Mn2+ transporter
MNITPFPIVPVLCFAAVMLAASAMPGSGPVVGVALFVAAFIYAARNSRREPPGE